MGSLGILLKKNFLFKYPQARRDDTVIDNYHGIHVSDPYRWLEDSQKEEVKEFVKEQSMLTESFLETCELRQKIRDKITTLMNHPRFDVPFKRGGKYFYYHNSGLQAQRVLYMKNDLEGKPEILLDPNTLSKDGNLALQLSSVSEDAKFLAYGISSCGSDWMTIKVMRIDDKIAEPDSLSWVKFSNINWTHDGKGFFYSRYPAPASKEPIKMGTETHVNLNHSLYYHFLGTDQSEDILCWTDPEHPTHLVEAEITEDGKYLLLYIEDGCAPTNKLYYCNLSELPNSIADYREGKNMIPFIKLIDDFKAHYLAIANDDSLFTFLTNHDAPKYKLVRVDINEPEKWSTVLEESRKDVLQSAFAVNDNQLLVSYLSDVKHVLQIRNLTSGSLLHQLPIDIGTVYGISGRRNDSEVFIGFTNFLTPGIIYRCMLRNETPDVTIFQEIVVSGFDRDCFEVKQVFVQSKDGTKIPLYIVSKKDIILDGLNPCLLYGYGGFNTCLTPSFSVSRCVLVQNLGTMICIANIRGGGEYGEEWHKGGSLSKKQNCFDDFISAAEYLVSSGYTRPSKLCIEGGSNGGLLVATCINQHSTFQQ